MEVLQTNATNDVTTRYTVGSDCRPITSTLKKTGNGKLPEAVHTFY
jgi:hypothetical protein